MWLLRPGAFLSLIGGMDGAHCTTQKTHLQAEQPAQFPTQQYSCADNGDAEKEHCPGAERCRELVAIPQRCEKRIDRFSDREVLPLLGKNQRVGTIELA